VNKLEEMLRQREAADERLEKDAPDLYHGFKSLVKYYYKPGALSRREKELMAVAVSVGTRCITCLGHHANNAVAAGASREQVIEAAAIGVEFGGGPSFVMVRENLLPMLDDMPVTVLAKAH
jgi:AhpD family alkylhydroperoxidase